MLTVLLTDMLGMFGLAYIFELFSFLGLYSMIVLVAVFVFGVLPLYVLGSLGLMRIAQSQDMGEASLAWLPFCQSYVLGKLAFDSKIGLLMVVFNLLAFTGFVPVSFALIPFLVLKVIALHEVYKKMSTKTGVLSFLTIASGMWLAPILLFKIRNNKLVQYVYDEEATIDIELSAIAAAMNQTDQFDTIELDVRKVVDAQTAEKSDVPLEPALEPEDSVTNRLALLSFGEGEEDFETESTDMVDFFAASDWVVPVDDEMQQEVVETKSDDAALELFRMFQAFEAFKRMQKVDANITLNQLKPKELATFETFKKFEAFKKLQTLDEAEK